MSEARSGPSVTTVTVSVTFELEFHVLRTCATFSGVWLDPWVLRGKISRSVSLKAHAKNWSQWQHHSSTQARWLPADPAGATLAPPMIMLAIHAPITHPNGSPATSKVPC